MVHDYPDQSYTPPNDAQVSIYLFGALAEEFTVTIEGEDDDYYVAKVHWPSGQIVPCNGTGGCP